MNIENIIIYLRKSRSDNPDLSVAEVLARHEQQLQEYAEKEYGIPIPQNQIYREVVSGETIADRPIMRKVMALLETGKIQGVLVVEPQRLSRGDMEDCGHIINVFRYTDTKIITPGKIYDLAGEYDRKFFEMELTRGNDYLEYTKRILNRGRLHSVKEGNFIGSVPPYGYEKVKVGTGKDAYHTLQVIPEEADTVRLMYDLFTRRGYGYAKIAQQLNQLGIKPRKSEYWSPASIRDFLANPVYAGKIRWNWRKTKKSINHGKITKQRPKSSGEECIIVEGKHPAIIDEETYHAALDRLGKNVPVRKNRETVNPFAGLLFCGACGHAMCYKGAAKGKSAAVKGSMVCSRQSMCHTKSVQYTELQERVCNILEQIIQNMEISMNSYDENEYAIHERMMQHLQSQLKKLREKDIRQKDAFDDGIYTREEYLSRNSKVQSQIKEKMRAIEEAGLSTVSSISHQERIICFTDCLNALRDSRLPAAHKNLFLKNCIERIDYINHQPSRQGVGRYVANIFELNIQTRL